MVIALLAATCGASEGGSGAPPSRPAGAGDVVVQVMMAGGFVPIDRAVSTVPTVTELGGGTVISQAPVTPSTPDRRGAHSSRCGRRAGQ